MHDKHVNWTHGILFTTDVIYNEVIAFKHCVSKCRRFCLPTFVVSNHVVANEMVLSTSLHFANLHILLVVTRYYMLKRAPCRAKYKSIFNRLLILITNIKKTIIKYKKFSNKLSIPIQFYF